MIQVIQVIQVLQVIQVIQLIQVTQMVQLYKCSSLTCTSKTTAFVNQILASLALLFSYYLDFIVDWKRGSLHLLLNFCLHLLLHIFFFLLNFLLLLLLFLLLLLEFLFLRAADLSSSGLNLHLGTGPRLGGPV